MSNEIKKEFFYTSLFQCRRPRLSLGTVTPSIFKVNVTQHCHTYFRVADEKLTLEGLRDDFDVDLSLHKS
jgi:hypothetical protein